MTLLLGHKLVPRAGDPLPWDELDGYDGVYFTGGDAEALRRARAARVLVATARELPTLCRRPQSSSTSSCAAPTITNETYAHGDLDPPPRLVVATEGEAGGTWD